MKARAIAATLAAAAAGGVGAWTLAPSGGDRGQAPVRTPAPARAGALPPGAGALVRNAEELVSGTPAQLGYRLRIAGPRADIRGETDRATRTITLFLARHDVAHRVAHDLAHELGHAYDDRRMTDAQRRAYLRRRGVPNAAWWPGGKLSDYGSGAGDFAEVFALCHAASPEFRSRLAPRPANPCALLPAGARTAKLDLGGSTS
jgi:hypothetical protein